MQHSRDDAGGAIGGGGDHPSAKGVFFIHGQGVEVDPVQHRKRVTQTRLRIAAQLAIECSGAASDLEPTRQDALIAATGSDAVLHHLPDPQQAAAGFAFRAPGRFVGQHDLADRQVLRGAMAEQFLGSLEREGQHRTVFDDTVGTGGIFIDDKATAHRVVLAAADLQTGAVEGAENHAVGVIGQRLANHRQVLFFDEADVVLAQQL
ncbi:hypothetical protein D3C81_1031550 [compost metagenome]